MDLRWLKKQLLRINAPIAGTKVYAAGNASAAVAAEVNKPASTYSTGNCGNPGGSVRMLVDGQIIGGWYAS